MTTTTAAHYHRRRRRHHPTTATTTTTTATTTTTTSSGPVSRTTTTPPGAEDPIAPAADQPLGAVADHELEFEDLMAGLPVDRDDFEFEGLDMNRWHGEGFKIQNGTLHFHGQLNEAHLFYLHAIRSPFTVRARVRRSSGLEDFSLNIGVPRPPYSPFLFQKGSIRAVFTDNHMVLEGQDGSYQSSFCKPSEWYTVILEVERESPERHTSVTLRIEDDPECKPLAISPGLLDHQWIRVGSDCTGACTSDGGGGFDWFEVTGEQELR